MTKILRVGILAGIFLTTVSFMQTAKEPVGKITFPLNRVFVIREGSSKLQMAHFNMDMFEGDKVETKRESRCEITLKNGDVVRIDENSIYTLEKVQITEKTVKAESFLSIGKLWSTIKKVFTEDDEFSVKSPAAVIAVRGTIYRLNVEPDSSTMLRVYDGKVEVSPYSPSMGMRGKAPPDTGPRPIGPPRDVQGPTEVSGPRDVSMETWLEIVKAQQQIIVKPDGSYKKSDFNLEEDAKSDWVQWNKKRDEMLRR